MTEREAYEAGAEIVLPDEAGQPMHYVPASIYENVVSRLQAKLQEQNTILEANITTDTWDLWRSRTVF